MKTKDLGNKEIMSENIKRHLSKKSLNVKEFSEIMGFKYTTVLDWVNAKTYPRIDKIELMSRYFGVDKSDLVEKYSETSSILSEINKISSQLEEPRQKVVLNTATNQLDEQNQEKKKESKIVSIKNEQEKFDLADLVDDSKVDWDKWVSFDGRPLTDEVKEAMKKALGKELEDK
ncbi:helix-turn-helix domain-containing protein [Lactococcus lactis]|uniref:Helix-turn-helix domain-containing protein n=4 Tax=Lactococcus lactis subsp. cremoris TaxID=1359 RepID=A0A1V0PGV1_LACLC|nr:MULTISPECIES: helix-turn-helix domain-containing protein [Lactococcus]ARE28491.2 helix-turn-helix domain-containing protein [Lactococcus cremoris]MDH5113553.1 helix-turn-helix domain-containing protein [Lactococcus lactis]